MANSPLGSDGNEEKTMNSATDTKESEENLP